MMETEQPDKEPEPTIPFEIGEFVKCGDVILGSKVLVANELASLLFALLENKLVQDYLKEYEKKKLKSGATYAG